MTNMFPAVLILLLASVMTSCTFNKPNSGYNQTVITLKRTACFGTCPIYDVTVYGDGRVVYNGKDFVKAKGKQNSKIPIKEVHQIVNLMQKSNYLKFKDQYIDMQVTDMPYIYTSLTWNGITKKVERYAGDESAPKVLKEIEDRIDKVTNTKQWVGE